MFSRSTQRNQNDSCTAKKSFREKIYVIFLPSHFQSHNTLPIRNFQPLMLFVLYHLKSAGTTESSSYALETTISFSTVANQSTQLHKTNSFIPSPSFCSLPPMHKPRVPSHCLQNSVYRSYFPYCGKI